jgi:hypothetical protein
MHAGVYAGLASDKVSRGTPHATPNQEVVTGEACRSNAFDLPRFWQPFLRAKNEVNQGKVVTSDRAKNEVNLWERQKRIEKSRPDTCRE